MSIPQYLKFYKTIGKCGYVSCLLFVACCLYSLFSCTNDPYESGNGKYSYYTAEMATFTPDKDTLIQVGKLDDNRTIELTQKIRVAWAQVGKDCRMMLYFNKLSDSPSAVSAKQMGVMECFVPKIALADTLKLKPKKNPITLISSWKSANGEYYNLHFAVKSGVVGKPITQVVGVVCDSVSHNKTIHLSFTHDQKDAPEFYSVEGFLSVSNKQLEAIAGVKNPSLKIAVNTYEGEKLIDYNQ